MQGRTSAGDGPQPGNLGTTQRRQLGLDGLDSLLHGGLPEGNAVLVQGAPGTGKSVLGLQFLCQGAEAFQEPGLLVTFEEHPRRLIRDGQALGWDLARLQEERRLLIVFTSPAVFVKEMETDHYSGLMHDYGIRRVVVDSLSQFQSAILPMDDLRLRFQHIVNALRRDGSTLLLTRELNTRETPVQVTPEEFIADTIIQLEYRLLGESRARLIEVLKHRGSSHSSRQHHFVIAPGGLQILTDADSDFESQGG